MCIAVACTPTVCAMAAILFTSITAVYYRYTYTWEYTTLAETLRPAVRRGCEIPIYNGDFPANSTQDKPLKIGIIMMYESTDNLTKAWSTDLLQPLIDNRKSYCDKHSYTLLDSNHLLDTSRAASWSKLLALEYYFTKDSYDYLMYLDMDTLIMQPEIPLEKFIDASKRRFDVLLTSDSNGINAGVFIMRNSPWTLWFLREAWNQDQLVPAKSPTGVPYPFRWEQRAFHYMTNSEVWQESKLPTYPTFMEIRSHFYILPQCSFNSYLLHPFDWHANRDSSQYAPGDFLIHFAGKRGDSKEKLMRYYIEQLQKQSENAGNMQRRLRLQASVMDTNVAKYIT